MSRILLLVSFTTCLLIAYAFSYASEPAAQKPIEVPPEDAAKLLIRKVDPVYPELAKRGRLQGTVQMKVTITENGEVTNAQTLSGHPFFIGAAKDAVKQWKYKPVIAGGRPVPATTTIEVQFSLGIPEADYKKAEEAASRYFKQEHDCRDLLNAHKFSEAEASCKKAVELAQHVPSGRILPFSVYQLAGHSFFYQRKFGEALTYYERGLEDALARLKGHEAELGYAYRDVAYALHAGGDLEHAGPYYEKALSTLEQAREHIGSEFLRNKYSKAIKDVLTVFALFLKDTGQTEKAKSAEKRADAIVIREGLKDD